MLLKPQIILLIIALLALPALARDPMFVLSGEVSKIADGDTIQFVDSASRIKMRVRLYGIDTPETEKRNSRTGIVSKPGQPYGDAAHQALKRKIDRQTVRLEIYDKDRYQRMVSVIWLGSRNINREMVREGWAWAYRQYLDRPHASEYIGDEEDARAHKLGLWKDPNPTPPWEFRRQLRISGE